MSTGTVGLSMVNTKKNKKKATVAMKKVAMAVCCQNQY